MDSLIVRGSIEGAICNMVIDTGSNITILRPEVLARVSKDIDIDVHPVDSLLRTVSMKQCQYEVVASSLCKLELLR